MKEPLLRLVSTLVLAFAKASLLRAWRRLKIFQKGILSGKYGKHVGININAVRSYTKQLLFALRHLNKLRIATFGVLFPKKKNQKSKSFDKNTKFSGAR